MFFLKEVVSRALWNGFFNFQKYYLSFIEPDSDISHYFTIYVEIMEAWPLTSMQL